jgi:nucleoside-diphosphate-sugar epimerase
VTLNCEERLIQNQKTPAEQKPLPHGLDFASIAEVKTDAELEEILSRPTEDDIRDLHRLEGDILVLGVGGKMGPSLAFRAIRASREAGVNRKVIAVARFSNKALVEQLRSAGIETIAADLLDSRAVRELPDAENIVYMAARKFGTAGEESLTWATNAYLPGLVADRYRGSRIAAWSTGNVYPLSPANSNGPTEESPLGPIGEYAQSALARERVFEYFSRVHGVPTSILRLNYAVELRYGVLIDLAQKIVAKRPIDLGMGMVNVIWQGYANSVCLRSLLHCSTPPFVLNLTSLESYSVRWLADQLGNEMGIEPVFTGNPGEMALLSDATRCHQMFGPSPVPTQQMITWVAKWVRSGGEVWNKPTHFEVKDGKF